MVPLDIAQLHLLEDRVARIERRLGLASTKAIIAGRFSRTWLRPGVDVPRPALRAALTKARAVDPAAVAIRFGSAPAQAIDKIPRNERRDALDWLIYI